MSRARDAVSTAVILVCLVAFWPVTLIAAVLMFLGWALQDAAGRSP